MRQVDRSGQVFSVAGAGAPGALAQCCTDPVAVAIDNAGHLFVADRGAPPPQGHALTFLAASPRVWAVNLSAKPMIVQGTTVAPRSAAPVAGNGGFGFRGEGGPALQAEMLVPFDIEFEDSGNMLLAETGGLAGGAGQIRLLDRGGTIRTVAGTGQQGFNGDLLKGTLTQLNFATGIAVDRCGNLLIADLGNGRLRQVRGAGSCPRR